MRVNRSGALAAALLAAPCTNGCGCPPEQMKTAQVDTVHTHAITLPSWAPDDPSPEFLRAWAVLKPTPEDEFGRFAEGDPARLALARRASRTWAAAYEFFGTLSDEQMERLFSTRRIRMPVKSLTDKQRAALDNWLSAWRAAWRGNPSSSIPEDFLVGLFKMGAREDLSNVDVGFNAQNEGRRVHVIFWVRQPDGSDASVQNDFAYM
jgi:hypothetical protein